MKFRIAGWMALAWLGGALITSPTYALEQKRLVEPIRIPREAQTFRDVERIHRTWSQRVWIEPFMQRIGGQPWFEEGLRFVFQACPEMAPGPDAESPELLKAGQDLLKRGCQDPLVRFLVYRMQGEENSHAMPILELEKLAAETEKLPGPKALAWFTYREAVKSYGNLPAEHPLVQRSITLTREVMKDGSYLPAEDHLFYKHLTEMAAISLVEKYTGQMSFLSESSPLGEWCRLTCDGVLRVRGHVNSGGKSGDENLRAAAEDLTAAWKLHPNRPEPAAAMIYVVTESSDESGKAERLWFDRVIAAQGDFIPAYRQMLGVYSPDWRGSHAKMQAFGEACLATGRFDLAVPQVYSYALTQIVASDVSYQTVYRENPAVGEKLIQLGENILSTPSRKKGQWRNLASLCVSAWLAGDVPYAKKLRAEIPGLLPGNALHRLEKNRIDLEQFENELKAQGKPGIEVYNQGLALYAKGDFSGAAAALRQALPVLPADRQKIARPLIGMGELQGLLESGEWVPLKSVPTDQAWYSNPARKQFGVGIMPPSPDYPPEPRKAPLNCAAPVGDHFEWRWTLPAQAEPADSNTVLHRFFLALRREAQDPPLAAYRWVTFEIKTAYRPGTAQLAVLDFMDMPTPVIKPFPLKEKVQVHVRYDDGFVTVEINGAAVFRDIPLPFKNPGYDTVVPGFDRETEDLPATDIEFRKILPSTTPKPGVPKT